jgi:hypothetical protein
LTGWRVLLPPTAFLGAYETTGGGFIIDLPRARMTMTKRQADRDDSFTALYEQRRPLFPGLARRAELMLLGVAAVVALATAANAVRMPAITIASPRRRRRSRMAALTPRLFPRSSAGRAGFDFAIATLWRSKPHRLTLACAGAIGFAIVFMTLAGVDLTATRLSSRLLVIQPFLYGSLLVGFRHVVRVPAELRANWAIQAAWRGRSRAFALGVQLAGMTTLVVPAILITMVPVTAVGGVTLAAAHALLGVIGAAIVLDALMLSYDKVAFTCAYVPGDNMRALAPIYALMFLIGATLFSRLELAVLTGSLAVKGSLALIGLLVVLRIMSLTRHRTAAIDFNEGPEGFHELGLHR